jgi:hypothetical protein
MITFDQILTKVQDILSVHAETIRHIKPVLVNRDLNGMVRLIVPETAQGEAALDTIASELAEQLKPHSFPAEQMLLFEEDMREVLDESPHFPFEDIDGVFVADRIVNESRWASIAPVSQGVPRVVFFSIKGGVGRSTAMAVLAWSLAQAGKRVLVVDLDLESPGLSSALLPVERQPTYGIADWLVEDLVDNGDTVFADMIATSTLSHDGEIYVVPAHGRNPGEYIAKLGRVWMPKFESNSRRESWPQRLGRLLNKLEEHLRPDVILIDSRSGIDEVASSCVTDLGASLVLLFAIDGGQTWSGYQMLFAHWHQAGVAQNIRERLQLVGAMLPETDTEDYCKRLVEHSVDMFSASLYDAVPPGATLDGLWNFDSSDEDAPHFPWPVRWHRGFAALSSLHSRLEAIDKDQVKAVFGAFVERCTAALFAEGEFHD